MQSNEWVFYFRLFGQHIDSVNFGIIDLAIRSSHPSRCIVKFSKTSQPCKVGPTKVGPLEWSETVGPHSAHFSCGVRQVTDMQVNSPQVGAFQLAFTRLEPPGWLYSEVSTCQVRTRHDRNVYVHLPKRYPGRLSLTPPASWAGISHAVPEAHDLIFFRSRLLVSQFPQTLARLLDLTRIDLPVSQCNEALV